MLALAVIDRHREVGAVVVEVFAPGTGDSVVLTVTLAGDAALHVHLEAFEVVLHDEVDDARDRVSTVNSGSAAGQYLNAFDQRRRDGVDVHRLGAGRARYVASAVDQHQGTLGAHAAKLQYGLTGRAEDTGVVGVECGGVRATTTGADFTGQQRGNGSNNLGDVDLARQANVLTGNGLDGDRSAEVRVAGDARAGNGNFVNDLTFLLREELRRSHKHRHRDRCKHCA